MALTKRKLTNWRRWVVFPLALIGIAVIYLAKPIFYVMALPYTFLDKVVNSPSPEWVNNLYSWIKDNE